MTKKSAFEIQEFGDYSKKCQNQVQKAGFEVWCVFGLFKPKFQKYFTSFKTFIKFRKK